MSDIFREVDEEVRREHYGRLWRRYGPYVIGLAIAIVIAVAGYQGWVHWRQSTLDDQAETYLAAMQQAEQGGVAAAIEEFAALADDDLGGYPTLARLQTASLQAEAGETDAAIATWDALASDTSVDLLWRDLATVFSVMHQMDGGDANALEGRLQPLTQADRPFATTALELSAVLALEQGAGDRAAELLRRITDDAQSPAPARARAAQLLRLIE